jgi:hypothetical protein
MTSNYLTIKNAGNVGIGIANPSTRLHISSSTGGLLEVDGANAVNALFVSSSGNVGIGTSSPSSVLDIKTSSTGNQKLFSVGEPGYESSNYGLVLRGNDATGIFSFFGVNAGTQTTNAILAMNRSSGNVLIGTTTDASYKLQVQGTFRATGAITQFASAGYYVDMNYIGATYNFGSGETTDNIDFKIAGGSTFTTGGNFRFYTQTGNTTPSERMRISALGNIGIGRGANDDVRMYLQSTNATSAKYALACENGAVNLFLVRGDGLIQTGTASGSPYNNTSGAAANMVVNSSGTLERSNPSSIRFKENVVDWDGKGLETILALKPKTFTYKEDCYRYPDRQFLGLIAEEVAEVSSFLADFENEDGTGQVENVRYANIVVPLIKAVQELFKQNEELSNRLIKLESK